MTQSTLFMPDELYQYYLDNSLREHPILTQLRVATAPMSTAKMQIAPEEGQLLALLVKLINAKKTIDIGVFTGYSALVVAMALPEEGQIIACDNNAEWTKIALKFWQEAGQAHKIKLKLAPATQTLEGLIKEGHANTFDFIFIDADKKSYELYYELSLSLLAPGGIIAVDNVFQSGRVADPSDVDQNTVAIRSFNAAVLQDDRIDFSMIPIADGLTVIWKR